MTVKCQKKNELNLDFLWHEITKTKEKQKNLKNR